jgi:hypothetical protein
MAVIDYSDVTSLRYAKLSPSAKALIPVLATLADKQSGLLPQRFSKLQVLATFAGISPRSTGPALQKLHDTKRISLSITHGHPAQIIYLPIAQFSSRAGEATISSLERQPLPLQDQLIFSPDQPPDSQNQERQDPCLNSLSKQFKTTTGLPVPKILIKEMIRTHGASVVVKVISGMEKKAAAGEEIENPGAYFRQCCQNGWEPTSKNIQEKEKRAEQEARAKERQTHEKEAQEAHLLHVQQEQSDPDVQKRIRAAQDDFWKNLDTFPDQASGHARPASSF